MIVYATAEAPSFPSKLASALADTADAPLRWIVIFSPTGGESLLRALGLLVPESSKVRGADDPCWVDRKTFIASIGPTTSDYMKDNFGFEVDVCAAKPRPEGVRQGIEGFMKAKGVSKRTLSDYLATISDKPKSLEVMETSEAQAKHSGSEREGKGEVEEERQKTGGREKVENRWNEQKVENNGQRDEEQYDEFEAAQ
ncbi:MAG: hypothetical protein Q9228_007997, partial [Teloschistes exilis]